MTHKNRTYSSLTLLMLLGVWTAVTAQVNETDKTEKAASTLRAGNDHKASKDSVDDTPTNVLTADEWKRVDKAVERALTWLAAQQRSDGSFPSLDAGQPGVTSLCVMAFISHGHAVGDAQYGSRLERAVDFVLSCQKENGLITELGADGPKISRYLGHSLGVCTTYNHAISSLLLSEFYGMSEPQRARRMEGSIKKALTATLQMQRWPKDKEVDKGGWRYIDDSDQWDSDLSVTGWNLMFLRSARNAGFDVPKQSIDDAVGYIRRCYSKKHGTFEYRTGDPDGRTRAMAGAGILALAHAGYHNSAEAQSTGDWILKHGFESYNESLQSLSSRDRYHYSLFNCCQGMYQLGGKYWKEFFPRVVPVLLANQQPDGSWPRDAYKGDAIFGNAYTTALVVITLGAPNQLLPIFQR
jgi:hypothetical protein